MQITNFLPSFDSRSFVPIRSSKTSSQTWSKPQRTYGERASTLPRTKPRTYRSPTFSEKPSISIFPAPKLNSSPTPSSLMPKPSDSLYLLAAQLSDLSPLLQQPQPKPSVSPTLIVPTPRLSPSPTSLCQGMSLDGQGSKQPSPVAKERLARSITISNTKVEPKQSFSNEAKHEILDQEALLDFTYPELRRSCPMTGRESRHQTHSEPRKQAAMSLDSSSLQGKVGFRKKDNISKDKPKPPPRNLDFSAISNPKSNIKQQQQEFLPCAVRGTQTFLSSESEGIMSANVVHRESQSVFDGLATQRKCTYYPQNRYYTQTADLASNKKSYEQMYSEKPAALPLTPTISFSTGPLSSRSTVSPNIETRRRQFDVHNETQVDAAFQSGFNLRRPREENRAQTVTGNSSPTLFQQTRASQHVTSPQRRRFWWKAQSQAAQTDVQSTGSQSDCFSTDYCCQSRHIDQETEASPRAHGQLITCPLAPQTQEASRPSSAEFTTSQMGGSSKPDIPSQKHPFDQRQFHGINKNHKEVNLGDMWLNQTDIFALPDHHSVHKKLLEYPPEKCAVSWPPPVAHCPFNPNSSGIGSKGVFDLPSQPQCRVYQRPEGTTATAACPPANQVDYPHASRAFIMEEPEDPYYVTMYYPGSVYVGEYTDIQLGRLYLSKENKFIRAYT